jgi:RHS repeat-associated protein
MYYVHTDHLGSYCAITDANKQVRQSNRFDPWGNNVGTANYSLIARGFTGHEHYPQFKIINMNGRIYDPVIARFFSPDKYVANSSFTQDFNRYTYARNNPLMYTDPDGEFVQFIYGAIIGGLTNWAFNGFQFNLKGLAYFGIGAAAGAATAGVSTLMSGAVGTLGFASGAITAGTAGFTAGFISGAGNSWVQRNSFGQGLLNGLKAGGISTLTAGIMGGINGACEAYVNGGGIWTGRGAIFESIAPDQIIGNQITEGVGMEYSNSYAKEFSDTWFGTDVKGVRNLYADGSIPQDYGYYSDGDLVYNLNARQVRGLTVYQGWAKSDVYLFKQAFISKPQLLLTMGHEYGHAFFNTLPFALDSQNQHSIINTWEYQQASLLKYNVNYYEYLYDRAIRVYGYTYFPFEPRHIKF